MTTLFTSTEITTAAPIDAQSAPKRRGWLPLLTVLFCVSYALMTMLIVEQGSTIESQRTLIKELLRDSTELSATKMKAIQNQRAAQAHNQSGPQTSTQNPSTQAPSTQAQANQAPSSQAAPQQRAKNQNQKQFEVPSRPASDLSDSRRALIKI